MPTLFCSPDNGPSRPIRTSLAGTVAVVVGPAIVVDVEEADSVEDEHPVKAAAVIPTRTSAAMLGRGRVREINI
jgi:hypothetical protein